MFLTLKKVLKLEGLIEKEKLLILLLKEMNSLVLYGAGGHAK
jgi:hypothetical protein